MISLNKNLATRLSAQKLFEKLLCNNMTELDFSNVLIASRSFANELVNLEKKHKFPITKKNMNEEVSYIFSIADKKLDSDILKDNSYTRESVEKYADLI